VLLHLVAAPLALLFPRTRKPLAGALLADHATLCLAGMWPRGTLLGPNLVRLPADAAARRQVALTFDDGPDPEVTPRVLELLAKGGHRATFFPIARRAEHHPELVRRIVRDGHRLGNHTYHHPHHFAVLGPAGLAREIDRAQDVLTRLGGHPPAHFRAPAGIRNPLLEPLLAPRQLHLTAWTHRGFDTADGHPGRVLHRLRHDLRSGDILLLHDGNAARTPSGRAVALEVLPRLLETLGHRNLRSVPLPTPEGSPVSE
jgi:peptidoglycan/xylan/chitin deacetylase (PgdA/CDA1 family)